MRKVMWKKGLTVAMAAAMLAGPVSVPAVFNNGVAVVKADEDNKDQGIYVLMNIPYAEFYANEVVNNTVKVDAFTSATLNKTRTNSLVMAAGSYHTKTDGSEITGICYPVKVNSLDDLKGYKQVKDSDSVTITVTNRGKTSTTTYTGKDALFENDSYAYYVLPEKEKPSYYKELTKTAEGKVSFGKAQTDKTTEEITDANAVLKTETNYGDFQLNLSSDVSEKIGLNQDNAKVYGITINTDTKSYGLRHLENMWKGTELAWSVGYTTAVHGCPTSSAHYQDLQGTTIKSVTYYTNAGIFTIKVGENGIYVPEKFDTKAFKVENVDAASGSAKVTMPTLPEGYDAEYAVKGLTNVSVENGTLKYDATGVKPGQYTLNVTDKQSKYAPFSTNFILTTDNIVAAYNNNDKAPALVAAKDVQADDFANFVKNIQKVSVNGKEYAASGRGSVKLINADGTLVTTADALKAEGTYNIVVTAAGYNKTVEFTYTNKADTTTATKPSETTTATKPSATTATKPSVTTTATKPAKKVTVKKQAAKVKAGKKKLTVTWKKDKNVSGYQIQIATKKNFKGAKTYTVKSYKTYKKVIKKLKAKKKYFVKVRAYKTVDKSKVYGAYSAIRSCKVK